MIMAVEGDTDVRMMLKGNDKHGYVCVQQGECGAACEEQRKGEKGRGRGW